MPLNSEFGELVRSLEPRVRSLVDMSPSPGFGVERSCLAATPTKFSIRHHERGRKCPRRQSQYCLKDSRKQQLTKFITSASILYSISYIVYTYIYRERERD